jgi:hypothetical protein
VEPGALPPLVPQRSLSAAGQEKQAMHHTIKPLDTSHRKKLRMRFPEPSNFCCHPAMLAAPVMG